MAYRNALPRVGGRRSQAVPTSISNGPSRNSWNEYATAWRLAWDGPLLRRIWNRVQSDDCFDLAAQTSFYFSLSILPFCLVLAVIVGWLPSTAIWKAFATWIVTYLPRDSQRLMFSTILGLAEYPTGFLSFGLITALWSASAGFVSLMESLSIAYGARDARPYWRKYGAAIGVTIVAMIFILITFGLIAFGRWGFAWFSDRTGAWLPRGAWEAGRWAAHLLGIGLAVDFANFVLPDAKRRWHWLTPGSAFAVLALVGASAAFNLYVQRFSSYPRIYGAIGGFIILMLWIYIASLILLVGAVADSEIERSANQIGGA
jgi:membrane protein